MQDLQSKCSQTFAYVVAYVHDVTPLNVLESCISLFKFVAQIDQTSFVKVLCFQPMCQKIFLEAEAFKNALRFNEPMEEFSTFLSRIVNVEVAEPIDFDWLELKKSEPVLLIDIFTGKFAIGAKVQILAKLRRNLPSDYNKEREIAQYSFEDQDGVEMTIISWNTIIRPEVNKEYDIEGKVSSYDSKIFVVVSGPYCAHFCCSLPQ